MGGRVGRHRGRGAGLQAQIAQAQAGVVVLRVQLRISSILRRANEAPLVFLADFYFVEWRFKRAQHGLGVAGAPGDVAILGGAAIGESAVDACVILAASDFIYSS